MFCSSHTLAADVVDKFVRALCAALNPWLDYILWPMVSQHVASKNNTSDECHGGRTLVAAGFGTTTNSNGGAIQYMCYDTSNDWGGVGHMGASKQMLV